MQLTGLDHIQLAMPPGGEDDARRFYGRLLGLREIPKPELLAGRGGCWFDGPNLQIHLGVEQNFTPARKAHPAFLVTDLNASRLELEAAGHDTTLDANLPGVRRFYTHDPFGNRLEFMKDQGLDSKRGCERG